MGPLTSAAVARRLARAAACLWALLPVAAVVAVDLFPLRRARLLLVLVDLLRLPPARLRAVTVGLLPSLLAPVRAALVVVSRLLRARRRPLVVPSTLFQAVAPVPAVPCPSALALVVPVRVAL